jgi:hypothetical protein
VAEGEALTLASRAKTSGRGMSPHATADHLSFENVERGEECRGAVATCHSAA